MSYFVKKTAASISALIAFGFASGTAIASSDSATIEVPRATIGNIILHTQSSTVIPVDVGGAGGNILLATIPTIILQEGDSIIEVGGTDDLPTPPSGHAYTVLDPRDASKENVIDHANTAVIDNITTTDLKVKFIEVTDAELAQYAAEDNVSTQSFCGQVLGDDQMSGQDGRYYKDYSLPALASINIEKSEAGSNVKQFCIFFKAEDGGAQGASGNNDPVYKQFRPIGTQPGPYFVKPNRTYHFSISPNTQFYQGIGDLNKINWMFNAYWITQSRGLKLRTYVDGQEIAAGTWLDGEHPHRATWTGHYADLTQGELENFRDEVNAKKMNQ